MSSKYCVDQKVVYPSQGVGKVVEIFDRQMKDQTVSYYKIYIEASDMIVMVPIDKTEELGIRQIVSPEEADEALNLLSEDFEPITSDWKLRYQMNLDLLKKGTVKDIAAIVRCLYNRSKVKELPILERKLYDSAKKLLEDEISFALGKTEKEIETIIHTKLEPLGSVAKVKHVVTIEDEEDDDLMNDMNDKSNDSDSDSEDDDEAAESNEAEAESDDDFDDESV
jgi:CarD family transcriptional regulator